MRADLLHPGAGNLSYEIRGIVKLAKQIEKLGTPIIWENIGDPVAKGAEVPEWIRGYVREAAGESMSFAYSPTQGLDATRAYIAKERNLEGGIQITPDDILFFNGLGDAISTLYDRLNPRARVIGPNPAYPTHSSAEAAHAGAPHLTYRLDPDKGWEPDLADLEAKVAANPSIAGIIIINPDNPTGFVYPQETLARIVDIARRNKLFVISDEIYSNLAYEGSGMKKLASVIGEVPGIAMRGISKEFPWPGARCGWIEFYNRDKDENFNAYARKSKKAVEALGAIPGMTIHEAKGAFYQVAVFAKDALRADQTLPLTPEAQAVIEPAVKNAGLDQRFAYYLLAATGICVVPLSTGFNADRHGFRFTLLEPDEAKFEDILAKLSEAIRAYLAS
jgi:aspartate/methionine/tyrosine aminotransferase